MPTPSTAKWPRPKSEDEWEDMVVDAMRLRWGDPNTQRNGRRGQRQNGVDVYGTAGSLLVAAQAKNTETLSQADVKVEIAKAEAFRPRLHALHFAIGGPRDATLQEFVRVLSAERISKGNFAVNVVFFDDVCQELSASSQLIQKYWGEFLKVCPPENSPPKTISGFVLDPAAAFARIWELDILQALAAHLESVSNGTVHAHCRIEAAPQLDASKGTLERAWHLAIGEAHETHAVTLYRAAVDVDSGKVSFHSATQDHWLPYEEWVKVDRLFQ